MPMDQLLTCATSRLGNASAKTMLQEDSVIIAWYVLENKLLKFVDFLKVFIKAMIDFCTEGRLR